MSQVEPSQVKSPQSVAKPAQKAKRAQKVAAKGDFCLEGRFAGFSAGRKSPFRYLCVETATDSYRVKLKKSLQLMLFRYLMVGDGVRVVGKQTVDKETGQPKFKAREVLKMDQPSASPLQFPESPAETFHEQPKQQPKQKKARVLICQKSACRKRGGKAVCQALEAALGEAGLDHVSIKLTGCMDRCKTGPNLVVMPDKTRYARVTSKQIPDLVSKHFSPNKASQ
ncbi:MAG: (2Fe-2S) ferredoxin domain-containing protein [Cyanobacteria bacterium P01_G01_bin.38]